MVTALTGVPHDAPVMVRQMRVDRTPQGSGTRRTSGCMMFGAARQKKAAPELNSKRLRKPGMVAEALEVMTYLQCQIFHPKTIQGQKQLPGEQAAHWLPIASACSVRMIYRCRIDLGALEKFDMRKPFIAIYCLLLCLPSISAAQSDGYVAYLDDVEAVYVQDGDTPQIAIRMFGIDTPESGQLCEGRTGSCYRCGQRATQVLSGLLDGEGRYEFTGQSTYGRPVATIFIDGEDINLEMVRQGYAVVLEGFLPTDMRNIYLDAQTEARDAERGIWQGRFITPSNWRDGERLDCES